MVDSLDFDPLRSSSAFAHRTQTLHVLAGEGITPSPKKLLHELPVGGLVGGTVAAVEVHAVDLSRVVVSQACADEVAVRNLRLGVYGQDR